MKLRFVWLLILSMILLSSARAEVEETFYITFNDEGTAHIKQITTIFTLEPGYYIDAVTYDWFFPSPYENVQIHDGGQNLLKKTLVESGANGTIYQITTPEVPYEYRYDLFYEYDYPNAQVVYKNNFDIELFLLKEDPSITRKITLCLPKESATPISYDSSRKVQEEISKTYYEKKYAYYKPVEYSENTLNVASALEEPDPSFCSEGRREEIIPESYDEYVELVKDKYSVSTADTAMSDYEGKSISLQIPKKYESKLTFLKDAEKTAEYFKNLQFNLPDKYIITVTDKDDGVFSQLEDGGILCYDDGFCFVTNEIFRSSSQFQVANMVLAIVTGAFVKTYGEQFDNWWQDGSALQLTMDSMKWASLSTNELESDIATTENTLNFTSNDPFSSESRRRIATKIVAELESTCSHNIKKINEYMISENILPFNEQKNFNNFLIYAFNTVCQGKDIAPIFKKYNLEFDDVNGQKIRFDKLEDKANNIPNEIELKEFSDFAKNIAEVRNYFNRGDIETVSNMLSALEKTHDNQIAPLMEKVKRYIGTKEKIEGAGFNLFKFMSKKYLSSARDSFSRGDFISADKELDLAEKWLEKGPQYSFIALFAALVAIFAVYYYWRKKKKSRH